MGRARSPSRPWGRPSGGWLAAGARVHDRLAVGVQPERGVDGANGLVEEVGVDVIGIRISEVEIISMLIPASAIARNAVAETPGCEHPDADHRHAAILSL